MRTVLLAAAMVVAAACGGDSPTSPSILTITLTAPKQTIAVGEALQLTAIARDVNGVTVPGATITFTSSATSIATVDATGRVVGMVPGSTTLRASAGGVTSDGIQLTVTPSADVGGVVSMPANTFTPNSLTIKTGQSVIFDFRASQHSVKFATRTGAPADIGVTSNQMVTRAFSTAGTFPYECTLHPGMTGQVIVTP